jgi:TetR/AcrR family transcriptional repressor of nem operon
MSDSSKREATRARILTGAGRSFRSQGYGGAGVDGLAREAGVTSGAFYSYFKSKADAFRATVVVGMQDLVAGIRRTRTQHDASWVEHFVDFYLGERRTCALTESCALQSLTAEVARADESTRQAYEEQLRAVIDAAADGLPSPSAKARRNEAIVLLAMLSGGVSLARAVNDPALSSEIAAAIRASLLSARAETWQREASDRKTPRLHRKPK